MTADTLRDKFLAFFKSKQHTIVASDSLVPQDDPTVLFTPAGMNQFKKQFLGYVTDFRRAASSQRCLRTDDLDKVGKTRGHHTFFEMLGNFSFGDYFKEDAISWAWEFLTGVLTINQEQLWVSVYKDDDEAFRIWREEIKVPERRIVKLGDKQNFWPSEAKEKGPNGPCGPCSEIFFDRGAQIGCGRESCGPACDCGRFLEVWNLVFTQYNRKEGGILEPLPQKNIDTGMGLERLAAVMQGVATNFETDLFSGLTQEIIRRLPEAPATRELVNATSDHVRAIVFAIYDGVLPSNEGRGYVIRKLIRKSSLALRTLGLSKPFVYTLVPVLAQIMEHPYPQLTQRRENISEIILAEEKSFISILNSSHDLLSQAGFTALDADANAHTAFTLYDTYGIPWELIDEYLSKNGIAIHEGVFDQDMEAQKNRSKLQSAMKGDVFDIRGLSLSGEETAFTGYAEHEHTATIVKIFRGLGAVPGISSGDEARIVLDKTPFYGESGGQVGDAGSLASGANVFEVYDTKKIDSVMVHIGKATSGSFHVSDTVTAKIDYLRRLSTARNHTATHLLQAALRKVLGAHVQQQGSLVAADRLRFDFTHFRDITDEELGRIEETVNEYVMHNSVLATEVLPLAQAKQSGALAFFGDKYGEKVRVVTVPGVSIEFCGGTHLASTGQIGLFKIVGEGSVASGVRRIEAITGTAAYRVVQENEKILAELSASLGVPAPKLPFELQKRLSRIRELEKQLGQATFEVIKNSLESLLAEGEDINGIRLVSRDYPNADMNLLRQIADLIKTKATRTVAFLTTRSNLGISVGMAVTADLCARGIDASWLVKEIGQEIGGAGGGRKDFAQAGGNKPDNLKMAIAKLKNVLGQVKV
jgi:alanyl-tRNA synthetase